MSTEHLGVVPAAAALRPFTDVTDVTRHAQDPIYMQDLGKIKTLLEEGVLTEVEFNTKKAELIKQRKERKAAAEGDVGGQGAAGKSPQGGGAGRASRGRFQCHSTSRINAERCARGRACIRESGGSSLTHQARRP